MLIKYFYYFLNLCRSNLILVYYGWIFELVLRLLMMTGRLSMIFCINWVTKVFIRGRSVLRNSLSVFRQSFFVCENRWLFVHCGMPLMGLQGSTIITQCKSLFKEHISLDDLDSNTAFIDIGDLERFWNRVTEVTLNSKSVSALNMDSSEI